MTQSVPDADRVGIGTASQRERANVKETPVAVGVGDGARKGVLHLPLSARRRRQQ